MLRWLALALAAMLPCACNAPDDDDTAGADDDDGEPPFLLDLPIADPTMFYGPVMGFDHDPEVHDGAYQVLCTDYMGRAFPHCYDEHDGSDFMLEGGFDAMDAGSTPVIAAAPGTVIVAEDGNYDHCHGDLGSLDIDCDGHPMVANKVKIEHASGYRLLYWHLRTDSVAVQVGDEVETGDQLGLIGSSGISSGPHLHFEIQAPDETSFDPYAGEHSQPNSWWCDQGHEDGFPGGCD